MHRKEEDVEARPLRAIDGGPPKWGEGREREDAVQAYAQQHGEAPQGVEVVSPARRSSLGGCWFAGHLFAYGLLGLGFLGRRAGWVVSFVHQRGTRGWLAVYWTGAR